MKKLNKIYNQDCLKAMRDMPDDFFDLAIVDPPYGIGQYWMKQKHTSHYGKSDWNEVAPAAEYFQQLFRISKNQIIWGGNYFTEYLPVTNSWIVWEKGNDVEKMNTSECELAWTSFKIPMRKVFVQWSGGRKGRESGIKCIHPCQRPRALYRWLLQKYAEPGQRIIDTHVGSASSIIEIDHFGCQWMGFERSRKYYAAAQKRVKRELSQQRMNLNN